MSRAEERRRPNDERRTFVTRHSSIVLLVALCFPALWPMLTVTFWSSHDGLHHIFRLANFDDALRSGVLFPRWADQLGFGYGFPVTHYYAPLAYYLAELFHLLGAGFLDSIKLTYALGFAIAALGMYRLARDLVSPPAALLAAIAYAYYPYHIADVYMRGTLTEFMALALLPLVVWSTRRMVPSPTSFVLLFAIFLAALILTHNLTAFLFLPALVLYCVFLVWRQKKRVTWHLALATLLAFALAAFYLLPALGEVAWIRAGQVSSSVDELPTLLTPLRDFVAFSLWQPYVPNAPAALQHPLNIVVALLGLSAGLLGIVYRQHLSVAQRSEWRAWLVVALISLSAMLDVSAPLWANVRALAFVQFPYRLHALLGLAFAMLLGLGAETILRRTKFLSSFVVGLPSFALIASALLALNLAPQSLPGHQEPISESQINRAGMSEYDYQTALWARLYGGPWLLEYLPAWVTEAREEFFLPRLLPRDTGEGRVGAHIELQQYQPQQRTLRVSSAEPFQLSCHTFYFPAWQMRVDGIPVPTFPAGPLALVAADVPAGDHIVTLTFESTPLQRAGESISLLALGSVLIISLLRGQHRRVWLSLLLVLVVGVLGWRSLDMHPANGLQPIAATLDDQIDLVGYQLARDSYRPGETVELTLYWFARQTPAENFKTFVHLDSSTELRASGAQGRAGQMDAQPGFNFSPTTRWQRGEIMADTYRVKISAQAAPGTYDIYTGMYRPQPLQNLRVVSERAAPGDRVRLGAINVVSN